jgi:DNA (cytosine-5)-methyltransferase 1
MICTDITGPLTARDYKGISSDDCNPTMMKLIAYENHPADSRVKEMGETCTTVTSRWGTGGGNVPLVQAFDSYNLNLSDVNQTIKSPSGGTLESVGGIVQEAYSFDSLASNSMKSSNPISGCRQVELSKTLDTSCLNPTANQGGIAVAYSIREDAKANTFSATELDVANSIGALQPSPQSHHAQVFVAQAIDTYNGTIQGNVTATMTADMAGPTHSGPKVMQSNMAVRRLTPKECERLQGFPDGYTDIRLKGKDTPDGSRYKALGNSWAVPVVAWIGKRINHAIT